MGDNDKQNSAACYLLEIAESLAEEYESFFRAFDDEGEEVTSEQLMWAARLLGEVSDDD